MQRHSLLIFLLVWLGLACEGGVTYSHGNGERNVKLREKSIEFRWWQALLCGKELFCSCESLFSFFVSLSLSLSSSYRSQFRFGAVLYSVVLGRMCCTLPSTQVPSVWSRYYHTATLRFTDCHTVTAWYGQVDAWPLPLFQNLVQCKVASEYKCFLTPRQLALDTE